MHNMKLELKLREVRFEAKGSRISIHGFGKLAGLCENKINLTGIVSVLGKGTFIPGLNN